MTVKLGTYSWAKSLGVHCNGNRPRLVGTPLLEILLSTPQKLPYTSYTLTSRGDFVEIPNGAFKGWLQHPAPINQDQRKFLLGLPQYSCMNVEVIPFASGPRALVITEDVQIVDLITQQSWLLDGGSSLEGCQMDYGNNEVACRLDMDFFGGYVRFDENAQVVKGSYKPAYERVD